VRPRRSEGPRSGSGDFLVTRPSGALAAFVGSIWLDVRADAPRTVDRVMPRGAVDLVFALGEATASVRGAPPTPPGAVVAGPRTTAFVLDAPARSRTLGVSLVPGGASALVGTSIHELRDRHTPLVELWGPAARRLEERLLTCGAAEARIEAVQEALLARLRDADRIPHRAARPAAARIAAAPQRSTGAALRDGLGLSERRVEQIFRAEIGLSPTRYRRLERFRSAARDLDRGARIGWARFALEHGYYDQSHLSHEFRAHAGLTPREHLEARGPHPNHLPVRDRCGSFQDGRPDR